ncbi:hypothetical protein KK083_02100 [Fulvivirgaceae bacterium PWU4]|uniref:DUF3300 domain-containing protein n=1 Tax=Chryseosolibacter histidini TaxID=2782349 RepID=A0AAP2GMH0_9BACT|nr:hypothetical protein [Chryseosolibacter histidini]MBT1695650.1 hypothetical protein [Chryseosolibacter histidini]
MKASNLKQFFLALLVSGWISVQGQTMVESEVPGDNFSLEGALELFKKSQSPQQFEEMLNSPDSKVNNLDLNNDGDTDYVRVIDRNEGDVHAFILQAVISSTESQDVAVIELQKKANGEAVLQITGDADVYGVETIIEPTEEVRVNAGTSTARTVVNVWTWPSVQYVYGPSYSVWVSPWSWAYRPFWWRPWRPVAYYVYDPWWRPYRPYYAVCHSHRIGYLPRLYRPYRRTSVIVYNHYHHDIDRYRSRTNGRDRDDGRYSDSRNRYDRDSRMRTTGSDYNRRHDDGRNRTDANTSSSYSRPRSTEFNQSSDRRNEVNNEGFSRSQFNRSPAQRNGSERYRSTTERSISKFSNSNPVPSNERHRSFETNRPSGEVNTERAPERQQRSIERSQSQRSFEQRSAPARQTREFHQPRSSTPTRTIERSASPNRESGRGSGGNRRGRD